MTLTRRQQIQKANVMDDDPKIVAREFVGGPLHGEIIVMSPTTMAISTPVCKQHRKDPVAPEWMGYALRHGQMLFVGIFDNPCGHFGVEPCVANS